MIAVEQLNQEQKTKETQSVILGNPCNKNASFAQAVTTKIKRNNSRAMIMHAMNLSY